MAVVDTPATRALSDAGIAFAPVRTERPTSAQESADLQGVPLERLLRTIVVRRGVGDYVFVLVPGGRQIGWPKLRAHLGVKRLSLPDAEEARAATGYEREAITPFGSSTAWPVIIDSSAVEAGGTVAVGGGAHGVNVHLDVDDLVVACGAEIADIGVPSAQD